MKYFRGMTHNTQPAVPEGALEVRKASDDPCPEWNCPDLSFEDRREGRTCPSHPCTCSDRPYGKVPAEQISDAEAKELMTIHAIAQATGMSVEAAFDALTDIRKAAREAK